MFPDSYMMLMRLEIEDSLLIKQAPFASISFSISISINFKAASSLNRTLPVWLICIYTGNVFDRVPSLLRDSPTELMAFAGQSISEGKVLLNTFSRENFLENSLSGLGTKK